MTKIKKMKDAVDSAHYAARHVFSVHELVHEINEQPYDAFSDVLDGPVNLLADALRELREALEEMEVDDDEA